MLICVEGGMGGAGGEGGDSVKGWAARCGVVAVGNGRGLGDGGEGRWGEGVRG